MNNPDRLEGSTVILGVCGSIAAYKACELARRLLGRGAQVRVIMTKSATQLITPRAFSSLTSYHVAVDPFEDPVPERIEHISLADMADLILIAPATANTMAKLATGICDDMLTTTVCASDAPVVIAPAMNPKMWGHSPTQENAQRLAAMGYYLVEPGEGEMACGHTGRGRLAPLEEILAYAERALAEKPLMGCRVLVSTGPTRESIDPLRYLTNRSSGKMGFAIAYEAWLAGAEVTCVTGAVTVDPPAGPEIVRVETAAEMAAAVLDRAPESDAYIGAAAVADFRARNVASGKLKKAGREDLTLELVRTDDILAQVCRAPRRPRLVIGFAAETENIETGAAEKLASKGCDIVVANRVGPGGVMGQDDTEILVLQAGSAPEAVRGSKRHAARHLVGLLAQRLRKG